MFSKLFSDIFIRKMNSTEEILQNARVAWVIAKSTEVEPRYTVVRISEKTGYSKGTVSNYLNKKGVMSLEFVKVFCEKYGYDFDAVNFQLIDEVKNKIIENQPEKKDLYKDVNVDLSSNPITSRQPKNQDDMELIKFMKETIDWQRGLIEVMVHKIPDAEKEVSQHLHRKNG